MAIAETEVLTRTSWEFDPAHTLIEFSAKHMMVTTVRGRFVGFHGSIHGDANDPENAQIDVEIDASTLDTRNEQRDGHLRSADFLDVENFPTLTYHSTHIEKVSDDRLRVTGDLTVKDVTKPVTLDATINGFGTTPWGQEVAGITLEGQINRKDFGLIWNVALETGGVLVGDTIKIAIEIEAIKQA
ncbi:MAG TPA: YceI family protein [Chloroflexota bacterium]